MRDIAHLPLFLLRLLLLLGWQPCWQLTRLPWLLQLLLRLQLWWDLGTRPQSLLLHAYHLRLFKLPMHLITPVVQPAVVLPLLQGHGCWKYDRVILQLLLLKNLLLDVSRVLKHVFQGQGFNLRVVLLLL